MNSDIKGTIFNIQKFSVHDGPGIRTTVFMKGCPLRCRWCANPESMNPLPEPGIVRELCNSCGKCVSTCPEDAIRFDENSGRIIFDRRLCTACGECANICIPGAITIYGREARLEEIFKEVLKDKSYYQGSEGGVTVSGGEPLHQADFVTELFKKCRQEGIGTCLDTCGYADRENLDKVLEYTDFVLFDLKHLDSEQHRTLTGKINETILENARTVVENKTSTLFRIPLVREVNDTEENITQTARFIKRLGGDASVELLPYHRLGAGKYKTLDKCYGGQEFAAPSEDRIGQLIRIFEGYGIDCSAAQ